MQSVMPRHPRARRPRAPSLLAVANSQANRRPEMIRQLIAASQAVRFTDSAEMLRLARLAASCADARLTCCRDTADADLAAQAHRAHAAALRVHGDFQAAHRALDRACSMRRLGSGSVALSVEVQEERAAVFLRQRRHRSALRLLERVIETRRATSSPHELARALTRRAMAENETGQHQLAATTLIEALELVDGAEDSRLLLVVLHNLAEVFLDGDRAADALAWIEMAGRLYDKIQDPLLALRRTWIHGRMARELGLPQVAEVKLREARLGYEGRAMWYEAAFVGLELASLLAAADRLPEAIRMAEELANTFALAGIPSEAAAARLLRQASRSRLAVRAVVLLDHAAASLRRRR